MFCQFGMHLTILGQCGRSSFGILGSNKLELIRGRSNNGANGRVAKKREIAWWNLNKLLEVMKYFDNLETQVNLSKSVIILKRCDMFEYFGMILDGRGISVCLEDQVFESWRS